MNANEAVIVIGRQFGSGGREIGRALAARLKIPYYDKELLRKAASSFGFDEEIFSQADESTPSFLSQLLGMDSFPVFGNYSTSSMSRDRLYSAQSAVVHDVAKAGPCVIVGRTADYVCRDFPNLVSVFLHAPLKERTRRITGRGDCPDEKKAESLALRRDSAREKYYNFFTGRRWGVADNYHLSIDASSLPVEKIVDLIITYIENRLPAADGADGK